MQQSRVLHEKYWLKEKILQASDYERNDVLPKLFKKGERVIDVGCGDGAVAEFLKRHQKSTVIGIDFSLTALTRAQERGIPVVLADSEVSLPIRSQSCDVVFFGDVIEHLYFPQKALEEIWRVLAPGGRLVVSCPNMGYWRYRIHYLLWGIFPETEWIEAELWQSQHIRFFNPPLLEKLLRKTGFFPERFFGISRRRFDSPFIRLLPKLFGMIIVVGAKKK